MERTESILPFQLITSEHIWEVISLQNEINHIRYWKEKQDRFRQMVSCLSPDAKWLLTFIVWFSDHNTRFFPADSSRYYTLTPNNELTVDFIDFIELIQRYNRKRITFKNEIHIVRFLQKCDKIHFEFYLNILSKSFTAALPKTELYDILDLGIIDLQEVYGSIEILQTSLSELNFPVAVTMLPEPDYNLVVQAREPRRTFSYYQNGNKLKATKDLVTIDAKYINEPRYTVIGYSDVRMIRNRKKDELRTFIYPLDYFKTFKEFRRYAKTTSERVPNTPFKNRIEDLNKFLHNNYLRQFIKTPIGFAENETELARYIIEMYPRVGSAFVVITDSNTARTGRAVAVPVANTAGVINSIWLENGIPKGFEVWFNGVLNKVEFSFTGANNAILNDPSIVINKMLAFTYLRIGQLEVFVASHINWEQLQWKPNRYKGIHIEKCVLCGGTEQPHKLNGMCRICEINIRGYFDKYGADFWIKPSRQIQQKRGKSGWHPKILSVMQPTFQGHYIIAKDDGYWCFHYDEARYQKYKEYISKREHLMKKKDNDS